MFGLHPRASRRQHRRAQLALRREASDTTLESAVLREMGARIVGHQSSVSPAARRCGRVRRTGTSRTSIGPARSARTRDGR